jgi:hypothetical protein
MDRKTLQQVGMLGGDMAALWFEVVSVVWLRSGKIVRGGRGAAAEAELMIGEKIAAHQELATRLATGRLGSTPVAVAANATRYVLRGVRANRRRLAR